MTVTRLVATSGQFVISLEINHKSGIFKLVRINDSEIQETGGDYSKC